MTDITCNAQRVVEETAESRKWNLRRTKPQAVFKRDGQMMWLDDKFLDLVERKRGKECKEQQTW